MTKEINNEIHHQSYGEKIIGKNRLMTGDCSKLKGDCTDIQGDCTKLEGDCSGIYGDCSSLEGNCTGLEGNCTGVSIDFDSYEIIEEDREKGVEISAVISTFALAK